MFKRRNFATAMLFTFSLGMVLFGTTVIIPQFLQLQLGYSASVLPGWGGATTTNP